MASIRQKPPQPGPAAQGNALAPPDFRNLGVMLRSLLGINLLALVTVAVRVDPGEAFAREAVAVAGVLELPLMLGLLLAYLLAPQIARQTYRRATVIVMAVGVLSVALTFPLLSALADRASAMRWCLWAAGACMVLMAYFHWRSAMATPALSEARVLALNARIRPHFFFNSLNGVLGVIRSDPRRAEHALESLADLFRNLMKDNRELVTIGDEIELANRYLDLERLRLGDRLKVEWDIRHCPMTARVPPLMLQPLIENAVYHGIEPSSQPGEIHIRIAQRGRELHLEVSNPLRNEARSQQGNRMAQANIRERLMLFFDIEAQMESGPQDGQYVVRIRMPVRRQGGL
ncbi:histidine kinase [Niveibacterium umoris]|uniref:Two-component system sensor histidine kinase AlgZ n=1 Tax=Niveibacterium umoris TaxID=1193620 RepID=A0A840BH93_9RHOO|nr:histidine kinase [Niveibacterium umoris]MBB4012921.1 two-component system sensor histidine kinase AlgZ [Niveibacterium umoris]